MNILFCCTSMFHLFVTVFICQKYYSGQEYKKTLVLLSHMHAMCKLAKTLEKTGLWTDIVIIDDEGKEHAYINQQLDKPVILQTDIFHIFGFEYTSFFISHAIPEDSKIIFTDEGYSTWDILRWIELQYHREDFDGKEFPLHKVSGVWMFDPKLSKNNFCGNISGLNVKESIQQDEFRELFYSYLVQIWPLAKNVADRLKGNIVFFDSYFTQLGWISAELDNYILNEIMHAAEGETIIIKRHPNDSDEYKYKDINYEILDDNNIPWEVINLLTERENIPICITCSSNVVLNGRIIWGDYKTPIILLFKIYEDYSNIRPSYAFAEKYMEVYGNQGIYIPETFSELSEIIRKLRGEEEKSFEELYIDEIKRSNAFYKDNYLYLWNKIPSRHNVSTLVVEGKEIKAPIVIDSERGSVKAVFDLATLEGIGGNAWQWYVTRGLAIRVKVTGILAFKENLVESIVDRLDWENVSCDEEGYYYRNNFDSIYDIDYPLEDVKKIEIAFDYVCGKSYDAAVRVYREGMQEAQNSYKALLTDIDGRDKAIEELNRSIEQRNKLYNSLENYSKEQSAAIQQLTDDIKKRDDALQDMSSEIKKRDDALQDMSSEIEKRDGSIRQLMGDIEKRDDSIRQLTGDIEKRDNSFRQLTDDINKRDDVIQQLMQDIEHRDKQYENLCMELERSNRVCKENEEKINRFQRSIWGTLYGKTRKEE